MEKYRLDKKIQDFLNGELEASEQKELERELAASSDKQEAYRFDKSLHQVLKHRELFEVRNLIRQSIEREDPPSSKSRKWRRPRNGWWILLGSLTLIVLSFWGISEYQRSQQLAEAHQLSDSYLRPLENVLLIDEATEPVLSRGMQAYSRGAYADAVTDLENYFNRTSDWNAGLYLGIAYLFEQQPSQSEEVLQKVVEQGDLITSLEARWYLSLGLLQQGKIEEAKVQLQILRREDHPEHEKVDALLQEIQ